jgi:hypothetical protein
MILARAVTDAATHQVFHLWRRTRAALHTPETVQCVRPHVSVTMVVHCSWEGLSPHTSHALINSCVHSIRPAATTRP